MNHDAISAPRMSSEEFCAAGAALFGPAWRTALARALGISPSYVSNMEVGRHRISAGMASRLLLLADARAAEIAAIRPALLEHAAAEQAAR